MKTLRLIAALATAVSLSACASVETVTRSAPEPAQATQLASAALNISAVRISVPYALKVSEANSYYPGGDIVWREDPLGDRHQQVKSIFEQGIQKAAPNVQGSVPVMLDIEVTRFHALTEKARYTTGGVHAVQFKMRLLNPETGEAYTEAREIKADFKAFGGARAINAERNGITQKLRITDRIAEVVAQELANPGSFKAANNGFYGALNQI
ncbi:MAG: hypothetical protein P1U83_13475 [Roseovarius sp.]|nr:hypothetical protein [Roseovarius sp.]